MNRNFSILTILLLAAFLMSGCGESTERRGSDNPSANTDAPPVVEFQKTTHDFGKIITGERVAYAFRFQNSGSSPLIITGVRSGCGCTVGDYPKDAIKPGEEGKVNIVFNSAGRRGFQSESVRVLTNAEESVVTLRITAEVLEL